MISCALAVTTQNDEAYTRSATEHMIITSFHPDDKGPHAYACNRRMVCHAGPTWLSACPRAPRCAMQGRTPNRETPAIAVLRSSASHAQ